MSRLRYTVVCCLSSVSFVLCGCGGGASSSSGTPPGSVQLSVQAAGVGGGMISSNPAGINCGQACSANFIEGTQVTLTAAPMANSFFAGWSGACSGIGVCEVTLTKNASVTAAFNASQSTPVLTVSLAGNGMVSSNPSGINCGPKCSASFNVGTQVTLTATAVTNSYFVGWSGACSGIGVCNVTLTKNTSVVATFSASPMLTVTLGGTGKGSVASNPLGINCGPTCSASFNAGTQVTLTATTATNSYFAGWAGGGCSGNSPTCTLTLKASQQVTATFNTLPVLTVSLAGTGTGTVSSNPSGINCKPTCSASFNAGTQVTLTETPGTNSSFVGWDGACKGDNSICTLTLSASQQVTATFNPQNITALNHIIFLAQENRSFDHYFGALRGYWAQYGYPDQPFDGLPQFNPNGQPPAIPGCNPSDPPPSNCVFDPSNLVPSQHLITQCIETPTPIWNESHWDFNFHYPQGQKGATLDGFVFTAAEYARRTYVHFNDVNGIRAMGYYDGGDLNYYYFMASNFATSDRWFNPVMTRTSPSREYLVAATSQRYAYPVGTDQQDKQLLTATTIFQELQAKNISWKIYVN